jgi:hypothetical protein
MSKATRKPDAAMFPRGWNPGTLDPTLPRGHALCQHFEGVLGVKQVYIRMQDPSFVTASAFDTIYHPLDHPTHAGQPRYTWDDAGGGLMLGYLIPTEAPPDAS